MRRQGLGRGILSLENEKIRRKAAEEAAGEAGDGAENLETELIEVSDAEGEVVADAADVEAAEETRQALESMVIVLESALETGGLDRSGAALLDINMAQASRVLGSPVKIHVGPSLESFGGGSSRMKATSLALEDVKEKAKAIWKAIIDAIMTAVNYVKDFFLKIFGAYEKLKKRAEALKKRAEDVNGQKQETAPIENEGIVKALYGSDKKVPASPSGAFVPTFIKAFDAFSSKANASENKLLAVVQNAAGGDFGKTAENITEYVGTLKSLAPVLGAAKADVAASKHEAREVMDFYISGAFPGGSAIIGYIPKDNATPEQLETTIGKAGFTVGEAVAGDKGPTTNTFAPINSQKVISECDEIIKLADVLMAFRKNVDKMAESKKKIADAAKKLSDKALPSLEADGAQIQTQNPPAADESATKKEARDKASQEMKILKSLVASVTNKIDQPWVGMAAYGVRTGKRVLDLCELSLKAYSKE